MGCLSINVGSQLSCPNIRSTRSSCASCPKLFKFVTLPTACETITSTLWRVFWNDSFRFLLKPLGETLLKPNYALTILIFCNESFHYQDEGRHFDTTFFPISTAVVQWGVWSAVCSSMRLKVAVACNVWKCNFTVPALPWCSAYNPLFAFIFHQ